MTNQRGRSMVEMLGTLAIMGVLSVTGIWAYAKAIDSHKANCILNDLNARIHDCSAQMVMMNKDECQLSSFPEKMDDAYATSVQKIDSDFFKVIISDVPQKICQQILNKGIPSASHINLTSCNETNQFELIFHKNLDSSVVRKKCTTDADCDVCGSCDSDGYCLGECLLPSPDSEENCGENECIVYDEESKTCRDACERVEYLESTGTQYIDTGIQGSSALKIVVGCLPTTKNDTAIIGCGSGSGAMDRLQIFVDIPYYSCRVDGTRVMSNVSWNTKATIVLDVPNEKYTINGTDFSITYTGSISNRTLWLFGRNIPNDGDYMYRGYIYNCQIWDNGTLVRDFIPVISPDGEGCMFDKVSQKLFCNEGTGTFKTNKD